MKLVAKKEKKKNATHSNWNTRDSNSVDLSRDSSVLSRYTLVGNFKFHKFLMQYSYSRTVSSEMAWKFPRREARENVEWRIRKSILGKASFIAALVTQFFRFSC